MFLFLLGHLCLRRERGGPLASLLKPLAFEVPPSLATCLLSSRHLLFFQEPLALLGDPLAVLPVLENDILK